MIKDLFKNKKAFIGYLTAGDGGIDYCIDAALALQEGGVDLLEIGLPFSDPVADGPVIQMAMQRALQAKITPFDVLRFIENLRNKTRMPLVIMSYYNPIYRLGDSFLERAKDAGANGLLIVDLPLQEKKIEIKGLDQIQLVSQSTSDKRLEQIAESADGFIYYACQKGTTGARKNMPAGFDAKIKKIKRFTSTPVIAGFGIASKESAHEALQHADGFVVGSFFVGAMGKKVSPEELKIMAQSIDPRR